MTKNRLYLTVGLPASGKSTWAKQHVATNPGTLRLNRDDFRQMLFGKPVLDASQEKQVTVVQHAAVAAALKDSRDVVVDDTNFFAQGVKALIKIAGTYQAEVVFKDFTGVDLEECIRRDALREASVGESVIRGMYNRYLKGKTWKAPTSDTYQIAEYSADLSKPKAVIVDIDGTIAQMADRSPYAWDRVGEDSPVQAVLDMVFALEQAGNKILFTSGRDASCRDQTLDWLETHYSGGGWSLAMRAEGDNRVDWIIKAEIFDTFYRDQFNITLVVDDRPQVCRMWRKMGLTVAQVGNPDYEF